jgi:beta-phosphoglucomutase-like phosphatase (HAD superfamily)
MTKLIIFDLDGVLVEAKEIHYNTLNQALKEIDNKFIINE